MKKFALCLLLCIIMATGAFAEGVLQGNDYLSIGGQFSIPIMHQTAYSLNGDTNKWPTDLFCSVGPGVEVMWLKDKKIGVFGSVDFYFPMYQMNHVLDRSNSAKPTATSASYTRSGDLKDSWGMSLLVGPSIKLFESNRGLFTINPGLHYDMMFWKDSVNSKDFLIGIGLDLQYKFFLAPHFFLSLGGDLAWDFLIIKSDASSTETKASLSTVSFINPRLGLGYFF